MTKVKLTWRIWFLIFALVASLLTIFSFPPLFFSQGVVVKSVDFNSSVYEAGLRQGDIINSINNHQITNFQDYSKVIIPILNKNDTNQTTKLVFITNKQTISFFITNSLPIIVQDVPKTNLKSGLDLQGGARALVEPEVKLTDSQMLDLISVSNERFNVYGISDVGIRQVKDLAGNNFMLIEIAGATPKDLNNLISQQGKFEGKIGNETVFTGGNKDITYVCRNDANCAGIESCTPSGNGYNCRYRFVIHLSEEAAKRHADITGKLGINNSVPGERYLSKQLDFYVDDKLTTSLFISEDLKGKVTTQIQIQGSGSGADRNSAIKDAEDSMKKMQTILITGSLPYKLKIAKLDTISPLLGQRFNYLLILTAIVGLLAVSIIIFIRYRNFKASVALLFTSFSEILIILGIAALIKWNLDLPSIVGILVTIGTGVDQQIVILDESKSKKMESMKEKLKGALFIILAAFATNIVSLLPIMWAGAGLLKGFAVTTIIGLIIGVLITRPAFADIIKTIDEKNAS